jgi:8-oxo-dGTP pyrophosphatase MutT (NUDIX family)
MENIENNENVMNSENKDCEKFKPEILWESPERNENGTPYFTVKKARGYYIYGERAGVNSIAFILYDRNRGKGGEIGLIYEAKPPLDEFFCEKSMSLTAFGGSLDMPDKTTKEVTQIEVKEEAGYDVPFEKIFFIGTALVSTQMNQFCGGFLVDVTGLEQGATEAETQSVLQKKRDPDEFSKNKVVWMPPEELYELSDWKAIWIFSKAYFQSNISKKEDLSES